jgi:hypothetical protein
MKLLTPDTRLVPLVAGPHERFSSPREPKSRAGQIAAARDSGHLGIGATGGSLSLPLTLPLHPPGRAKFRVSHP